MSDNINDQINEPQPWQVGGAIDPNFPNIWEIEKRVSLLEQSNIDIKENLNKINDNISRLVWIVLTAVVVAILNILMTDGLPGLK